MKNITVEMLLENSKKIEKKDTVKVKVEELNGAVLELEVLDRMEILDILSSNSTTDKDSELIYTAGKIFKDEKLITELGCQMNPIEVVPKVLSQSTIVNISELLMKKAGWNEKFTVEEVVEEIKN
ncbi:regulator [Leptotrichia wadei]|uniref:Phage XkdN-like protein n=1 Tax=Leptotrichia wadei TaxID=157687 RepID=A0A510KG67_9FUSO|nr:regulator [Leptotrichia wadei]BBM50682.1 phage XkdN-like protein [Leptotrichia wadei]